jgi:hypothetical protein
MTVSIIQVLHWIIGVFGPGTGRRRAGTHPAAVAPICQQGRRPGPVVVPLPKPRSPYGLPVLLDGTRTAPIRPYVLAVERADQERECERARQTRRRVALVLAADYGVDLDLHMTGAERAA